MTIPQSIIVGAVLIALGTVGAQLVAPYQMASGPALIWRVNRITGEIRECIREVDARAAREVTNCE